MKCPKCHSENPDASRLCADCGTKLDLIAHVQQPTSPPPSKDKAQDISFTRTLETTTDELTRGKLFADRYEIIEELGAGGMGRVYRVYDTKIGEEVVLKFLRPEIVIDKKALARFRNEIKLARKITHKNVCRVHELMEERGTPFITMEYVAGEDLKSLIRRVAPLNSGKAMFIARQVAEGLAEAHKLGITHRDLKPGNIMIDKDGQAKVMDFGIARSLRGAGITGEGAIIGTPEYMSPEQVEGIPADQRADIYALGVILFEMVTGRLPFEGETPFSIANKQKNEPPPNPRKFNPQISAEFDRVILRSLEKVKEKRYQTTGEFLADLAAVEEALPTGERISAQARPKTSREITVKLTPKKLLVPAAGLIVLAVIAIFLWHPFSHKEGLIVSSVKPSLAVLPFENYSGDASLENWRYGFPELLFSGLSSSKYLDVLRPDEVSGVLKKLNLTMGKDLTSDSIMKIAEEAEVTSLLKASFVKAGADFIITATLVNGLTGETQATLSMKPQTMENILGGGLDGLVKEIKQGLNITQEQMASDIDMEIGNVMTRNPEALKYYVEGERFKYDYAFLEAIDSLKKAVELDPEFAMAYKSLGTTYRIFGRSAESKENYEKAFRLKDRMPPREYYIIQGSYYIGSEATIPEAIEMYKKVLDIYPDDYSGNGGLAYAYSEFDLNLASEQFSKILKLKPRALSIYSSAAECYSRLGEKEKATQAIKEFVANNPGSVGGHYELYLYYIMQRRFDLAMQEMDQTISLSSLDERPIYTGCKGDLFYFKDEPEEAARSYRTILDIDKISESEKAKAVWFLNNVDILTGRPKEALARLKSYQKLFEKTGLSAFQATPSFFHTLRGLAAMASQMPELALEEFMKVDALILESNVPGKREIYFREALAQLEMGNLPEAEKLTQEIDRLIPGFKRKMDSSIPYLRGRLALARKNLPDALKLLEEAEAQYPGEAFQQWHSFHAHYLDSLASACLAMGDIDKALKNFEKIGLLTYGRFDSGDVYARSYYNLGKIYEQKELKGKAGENYEKFISLWKDCEPLFRPLVDDARKRLAGLKGS